MTNANPLITLRNTALIWLALAVGCFVGAWWIYHFLSDEGKIAIESVEDTKAKIEILETEWIITKKNWEEMDNKTKEDERWNTMKQLVPILNKLVAPGTTAAAQNIANMKIISQKTGTQKYITWLESSWTPEAQDSLAKIQSDIAEIIPLFAGISELAATADIHGKITLASLIDYIQTVIVDKFSLGNVAGQIGIERVQFMEEPSEIGMYEVPVRFENVSNRSILMLLEFLRKTGAVVVAQDGNVMTLEHKDPLTLDSEKPTISSLKNLLITVKSLTINPTIEDGADQRETITTKDAQRWDVNMILTFYIRGVSRDHIVLLDNKIDTWLSKTSTPESLITQSNLLGKSCQKCAQASEIRDITSLLVNARAAYDSILLNEKTAKEAPDPLEVIERRTALITTLETLKKKLDTISRLLSSPTQ